MLPEGVYHWTAAHPEWEGPVSAYAIDHGVRLILADPIAVPDDVRALFGSREVATVLTSTWHERDAAALGFPVWAPAPDRPEDQLVPATRYAIGDSLFGMEAYPGRERISFTLVGAFRQSKPPSRSCHPCIQIPKGVASPAIMLPQEEHAREYVVARLWDRPNRAAGRP